MKSGYPIHCVVTHCGFAFVSLCQRHPLHLCSIDRHIAARIGHEWSSCFHAPIGGPLGSSCEQSDSLFGQVFSAEHGASRTICMSHNNPSRPSPLPSHDLKHDQSRLLTGFGNGPSLPSPHPRLQVAYFALPSSLPTHFSRPP